MANKLSVRPNSRVRSRADAVWLEDGSRLDLTARRLLILVHGYQNAPDQAQRSYDRFRRNIRAVTGTADHFGVTWGFFWPGDDPNKLISVITYSARVEPASTAGERLAEFLELLDSRQSVRLVGHSLGCRVILEALRKIDRSPTSGGARIEDVFLLAAAVPVHMCAGDPDGFPRPDERREHVFFSKRDLVLRWGFPRGQRGAHINEAGEAVGFKGSPGRRWVEPPYETKLSHGRYWASGPVAKEIANRIGTRRERRPPSRHLPELLHVELSRDPARRHPASRPLNERLR
jgi:pimeloyl-ACP methyl ester carboxylesterase